MFIRFVKNHVAIVGVFVVAVCYGGRPPRFGAVVTNDFTTADLELCFKGVVTTSTNAVFQFRDDGPRFSYEIDEEGMRRCEPGERVRLSIGQKLRIADRHAGLVVKGYSDEESSGFLLTRYNDSRSFGRGVEFWTGRLLLTSRDREIKDGDMVIERAMDSRHGLSSVEGVEASELKMFFKSLGEAYNSGDLERIKKMSGNSAERWLRWHDGEEKLGGVEVVGHLPSDTREVVAKVTLLGRGDDPYSFEAKFTMHKDEGAYRIEDMELFDGWNSLFDSTIETSVKLIKAINDCDLNAVRGLFYRCGSNDFTAVLAERGLTWVKEAMDNGVKISERRMKVKGTSGRCMLGCISIPDQDGRTNVVRRIVFVGGKIQRDYMAENSASKMNFKEWLKVQSERDRTPRQIDENVSAGQK